MQNLKMPDDPGLRYIFQHLLDYAKILEHEGKTGCASHVKELALTLCGPAKPELVH